MKINKSVIKDIEGLIARVNKYALMLESSFNSNRVLQASWLILFQIQTAKTLQVGFLI